MSLETMAAAAKSALTGAVGREPTDPPADRAEVLKGLHLAETAWTAEDARSGQWFVRDGDRVAFTSVTRNGAALTIDGQTTTFIPADRFADHLPNMREAIERGEFDAEIAAALHGSANVGGVAEVEMPDARTGDPVEARREQQVAALAREDRNPDGLLKAIFGDRPLTHQEE